MLVLKTLVVVAFATVGLANVVRLENKWNAECSCMETVTVTEPAGGPTGMTTPVQPGGYGGTGAPGPFGLSSTVPVVVTPTVTGPSETATGGSGSGSGTGSSVGIVPGASTESAGVPPMPSSLITDNGSGTPAVATPATASTLWDNTSNTVTAPGGTNTATGPGASGSGEVTGSMSTEGAGTPTETGPASPTTSVPSTVSAALAPYHTATFGLGAVLGGFVIAIANL